jgi:hypothetical protein
MQSIMVIKIFIVLTHFLLYNKYGPNQNRDITFPLLYLHVYDINDNQLSTLFFFLKYNYHIKTSK